MFEVIFILIIIIFILLIIAYKFNNENLQLKEKNDNLVKKCNSDIAEAEAKAEKRIHDAQEQMKWAINQIKEESQSEIAKIKHESDVALKKQRESIETNRQILLNKSEKELLVENVIATATYGSRINHLETILKGTEIINELEHIRPEITKQIKEMSEAISRTLVMVDSNISKNLSKTDIVSNLTRLRNDIGGLTSSIKELEYLNSDIDDIKQKLDDMDEIKQKINDI